MRILGISYNGPNPSACLLVDGELVAMQEEERFVRVKTAPTYVPANAAHFCLRQAGLTLGDIDYIAVSWDADKYISLMPKAYQDLRDKYGSKGALTDYSETSLVNYFQPDYMRLRIGNGLRHGRYFGELPEIRFMPHHLSHAASAFYCSGFDEASILTIDGSGEEQCSVLWKGAGKEISQIESIDLPHSLGWMYAAVTEFLGFRPYQDEGSIMGLSCYGQATGDLEEAFDKIAHVNGMGYVVDPTYVHFGEHTYGSKFTDRMVELLGRPRLSNEPIGEREYNIAWMLQNRLETIALHLAQKVAQSTGSRKLCLAGGVALNCKMNQVLRECGLFDDVFIQPVSSDAGGSLGAALILSCELGEDPRFDMVHAYWGPEYGNDEIKRVLDTHKIAYTTSDDISSETARRLLDGQILGWFQDRAEVGPRALGSRSILANPSDITMRDKVNDAVKYREPWRPFAPSILKERVKDYLKNACSQPFMIETFGVNEAKVNQIPAVVHVDGTVRPQTVDKTSHPKYRHMIEQFAEASGVPMVMNTSFNVKGEPIVNSVQDALRSFYGSGLDALAIGDFLLVKK